MGVGNRKQLNQPKFYTKGYHENQYQRDNIYQYYNQ